MHNFSAWVSVNLAPRPPLGINKTSVMDHALHGFGNAGGQADPPVGCDVCCKVHNEGTKCATYIPVEANTVNETLDGRRCIV